MAYERFTDDFARGRLNKALTFHRAAKRLIDFCPEHGLTSEPASSQAVLAAIAYSDAITITAWGIRSGEDIEHALDVLQFCVGDELPAERAADFSDLLSMHPDEIRFDTVSPEAADRAMVRLDTFAAWSAEWLQARGLAPNRIEAQ